MSTTKITMRKPIDRKTYVVGDDNKELLLDDHDVLLLSEHIESVHSEEFTSDNIEIVVSQVLSSQTEASFNVCSQAWGRI